jgi:hypothetical protein
MQHGSFTYERNLVQQCHAWREVLLAEDKWLERMQQVLHLSRAVETEQPK